MASLCYFIPDSPLIASQNVEALPEPLHTVLDGASWTPHQVANNGPDGHAGCMIHVHAAVKGGCEVKIMGYHKDRQKWVNAGDYWIGYDIHEPPTPKDLQRKKVLDGYAVELKGQNWIVPVIHTRHTTLPQIMQMSAAGPYFVVPEAYDDLMQRAEKVFAAIIGCYDENGQRRDDAPLLSDLDAVEFCADVLNLNYRMHTWEMSLLELLTVNDLWSICFTAVGGKALAEEAEQCPFRTASDTVAI